MGFTAAPAGAEEAALDWAADKHLSPQHIVIVFKCIANNAYIYIYLYILLIITKKKKDFQLV